MGQISTAIKRLAIRQMALDASSSGVPLQQIVLSLATASWQKTSRGTFIVGTSGNGHSTQLQVQPGFGPDDVAELASELCDRYDEAVELLGASATDSQISTEMLRACTAVDVVVPVFSGLRYGRRDEGV